MCLSIYPSVCPRGGGVPRPGPDGQVPWPGPDREVNLARSRQGGYPGPGPEGYPGQVPPMPGMGYPPSHPDLDGYTLARSRWGYPGQVPPEPEMGYPPVWTWDGAFPLSGPGMGYPHLDLDLGWGTPPHLQLGQQKEYSLRGGRYASCIHTGGLSCLILKFSLKVKKLKTILREILHSQ